MNDKTLFETPVSAHAKKDLGIYYCGKRIQTKNHVYGPEIRHHYLFVFVNEGDAIMYQDQKEIRRLRKNDLFVMCPGENIYYKALTPWSIQWIGVYGGAVDDFVCALNITSENPVFKVQNHTKIQMILEKIYQISQEQSPSVQLEQLSLTYSFFCQLFREKYLKETSDYVTNAKRIIVNNINQPLSVTYLAEILQIHPVYLSRLFQKSEGISIKQYLLQKKIERAKKLLRETQATIEVVANSVGFFDPLYFSRIFRAKEGCSPKNYRKKMNADKRD